MFFQSRRHVDKLIEDSILTNLPQGPEYNNYTMLMYVKIIDDMGGVTIYNILDSITVKPNNSDTAAIFNDILISNPKSSSVKKLFSGDLKKSSQTILSLTSWINSKNYDDQNNLISSSKMILNRKTLINFTFVLK